jgi:hypothetical protein
MPALPQRLPEMPHSQRAAALAWLQFVLAERVEHRSESAEVSAAD